MDEKVSCCTILTLSLHLTESSIGYNIVNTNKLPSLLKSYFSPEWSGYLLKLLEGVIHTTSSMLNLLSLLVSTGYYTTGT